MVQQLLLVVGYIEDKEIQNTVGQSIIILDNENKRLKLDLDRYKTLVKCYKKELQNAKKSPV